MQAQERKTTAGADGHQVRTDPAPQAAVATTPFTRGLLTPDSIRTLQRTVGNAAVVQLARQEAPPAAAGAPVIQRIVKITPAMYQRGLGVEELTRPQLGRYFLYAVRDDAKRAAAMGQDATVETDLADFQRNLRNQQIAVPTLVTALNALVTKVNTVLNTLQTEVPRYNHPNQSAQAIVPNSMTRYARENNVGQGYEHSPLPANHPAEPSWRLPQMMHSQVADALGPLAESPDTDQAPRGNGQLPLKQLTMAQASSLLPRPLMNLIFDVRFQLEDDHAQVGRRVVIDERTPNEKARQEKSPVAPGTLRSWHQDDSGKLPDNGFDPNAIPEHARALHTHYETHSQSGAGASIVNAATAPRGFAEYTGAGEEVPHNVKVVLDYIQKRVYLTVTHYQYWALIPDGAGHRFWQAPGQNLAQAQGALAQQPNGENGVMMSPWVEIQVG